MKYLIKMYHKKRRASAQIESESLTECIEIATDCMHSHYVSVIDTESNEKIISFEESI